MRGMSPINRGERLAYINHFHTVRDLAIDSPFHYLLFDEDLSPVLQALTLDKILEIHPTDAPSARKVDASPSRPLFTPGGLMEQSKASLQRGRQG